MFGRLRAAAAAVLTLSILASCAPKSSYEPTPVSPITDIPQVSSTEPVSGVPPFVLGIQEYTPPNIPIPQKGVAFADPNFGITLRRITDKKLDQYIGPGIQNEYAKMDPENADGTLVILRGNSAVYYLYSPTSGQLIRQISDFDANHYAEPEPRWDPSDPKVFFYLRDAELRKYDVDTNASTLVHDFSRDFPGAALITTKMEGDASLDRRYWALMVEDSQYALKAVICYDRTTDKIVGTKTSGFPDKINWVGMSMSGNHVIVGYEDRAIYTQVFSRDFQRVMTLPEGSAGHGDAALTHDGRDVYVYQNVRTDFISAADIETGVETPLLAIPFNVNTEIGLHISGNNARTPGWVLVSTYGSKNPPSGRKHSWMDTQLFMVELKASPRIWRIAHTHAYTSLKDTGQKNYFAEAFATINSRGTRIYFGSNWDNFTPDYAETYQAELPSDWVKRMPR